MPRTLTHVATILLLASAVLTLAGCSDAGRSSQTITIGYLGGISGKSSGLGLAGRDGAVLAIEQANAAAGPDGPRFVLEVADDGAGPGAASAGVQDLVNKGAVVIIGPVTSVSAVEAAPVANELRVPILSPTVTSTDFTGARDYFLRTCSDNQRYGSALASEAVDRFDAKTVGIVLDDDNASYTRTLAEHFLETFESRGGTAVGLEAFGAGDDVSYADMARRLAAKQPDCVFVIGNPIDSGLICQRLKNAGYEGRLLFAHWAVSSSNDLLKAGGRSVDGAFFLDNYDRDSTGVAYESMKTAFTERFSYEPGFASVHSYDATRLALAAAVQREDDEDMRDVLVRMDSWQALQDRFVFDRFGDTVRPSYPMTIDDGEFVSAGDS